MAHVIRKEKDGMTKRFLSNDEIRKKTGRILTLYKTVLENEKITPDTFNRNALP